MRRLDPVRLAEWRKAQVTSTYFSHGDASTTPQENQTYLAIYTRANPIVNADRASGTVATERDLEAWQAAARAVAAQTHTQPTVTRALLLYLLQNP